MPNIPQVPGVPLLSSYGFFPLLLLVADEIASAFLGSIFQQWDILLDGISVIDADSMVSFSLKQDFVISDYPVEAGGFQSYNKVQLPTDIRVRMACGGTEAARQAFLASIDAVMNTTLLFDVITPESIYLNYNFHHRDFDRRAQGVGLIVVDLWLVEVRESAAASFQSTQEPGEAGITGVGNVQPQAAPAPLAITVNKGIM